ncbi:MAG TPA: transporter substrate-binding domain-containing protein [Burkholderiaceae bacterium]
MPTLIRRAFVNALAATALSAAGVAHAAPCELRMRWNDDPPFSMRNASGQIVGINVDLVREALRRMGCSVRLVELPWARALAELEVGRLDVLPGMLPRAERGLFAHLAPMHWHSGNRLFLSTKAAKRWNFTRLAELRGSGFRLGAQLGVSYGPEFSELMEDKAFAATVVRHGTRRNLWQMLKLGRIDGLIANELSARYELRELGLTADVVPSKIEVHDQPAAVGFSRKTVDAEFVARFNKINDAMFSDGSYRKILRNYGADMP